MKKIITIATLIGTIISGFLFFENRYVLSSEFKKLETDVQLNKLTTLKMSAMESLYFFRKQVRQYPNDQDIADKLKQSEDEVGQINDKIKAVEIMKQ